MARQDVADVMILDIMLPSGLEILEQLRKEGNETPVLFLNAKDTVEVACTATPRR